MEHNCNNSQTDSAGTFTGVKMLKQKTFIEDIKICDVCGQEEVLSCEFFFKKCYSCGKDICIGCSVDIRSDNHNRAFMCVTHLPSPLLVGTLC